MCFHRGFEGKRRKGTFHPRGFNGSGAVIIMLMVTVIVYCGLIKYFCSIGMCIKISKSTITKRLPCGSFERD